MYLNIYGCQSCPKTGHFIAEKAKNSFLVMKITTKFSKEILNGFDHACFRAVPIIQASTNTSTNFTCLMVPLFVIWRKMIVEK